jgi:hypothetical protein
MQNPKQLLITTMSIAALTLFLGCQTNKSSNDERSAGRALDDKEITGAVKTALKEEPTYKFTDVQVATFAGTVQLSGFVNTPEEKRRAEQIAGGVGGVQSVANGLGVKPPMPEPTGRINGPTHIYAEPQKQGAVSPKDGTSD